MPGVFFLTINKESKIIEFETSPKEHELSGYRSISRFHRLQIDKCNRWRRLDVTRKKKAPGLYIFLEWFSIEITLGPLNKIWKEKAGSRIFLRYFGPNRSFQKGTILNLEDFYSPPPEPKNFGFNDNSKGMFRVAPFIHSHFDGKYRFSRSMNDSGKYDISLHTEWGDNPNIFDKERLSLSSCGNTGKRR